MYVTDPVINITDFINEMMEHGMSEEEASNIAAINIEMHKSQTRKIWVPFSIRGHENSGYDNAGYSNSGSRNAGSHNTGDDNTGSRNSGNENAGNNNVGSWNCGNYNSGNRNVGDYNYGNRNAGYFNSGNDNSGFYNTGDYNTGCFNTNKDVLINIFDKKSNWTRKDWLESEACKLLSSMEYMDASNWIPAESMTNQEKKEHPSYRTTGGYLTQFNIKQLFEKWWCKLDEKEKDVIKAIPNFDAKKFQEITGIDVEQEV